MSDNLLDSYRIVLRTANKLREINEQLVEALTIISEASLDDMKKWLIAHKAHEGIGDFHAPLLMIRIAQTALKMIEVKK